MGLVWSQDTMTRTALLCIALLPALALAAFAAEPQYYNEVYTFSNGGGHATSTGYILDACVGQPAVGATWKDPSPTRIDLTGSESYYAPVFFPTSWFIDLVEGYNLISLPQLPDKAYSAELLLQEIKAQGGNATRALDYNGSGYDVHSIGTGTGFDVVAGKGYFVRCTMDSRWEVKGYPFLRASAAISLSDGYNLVGLLVNANPAYKAATALSEINATGDATRMLRYNGTGYDIHTKEGGGTNFDLKLGEGYFIRSTMSSTWLQTNN
jgi:hypothetical protein